MRGNQLVSILAGAAITYALLSNTNAQSLPPIQSSQPNATSATQAHISYQGRLTNSAGVPINTTVAVTFKLYDAAGTPVYTTTRAVTPVQGLFTVDIGGGTDPDLLVQPTNILGKVASIGVTVGNDPEMQPRQQLGTVIGHGNTTLGVMGSSDNFWGVYGHSINSVGVVGRSDTDIAIYAQGYSKTRPALAVDGAGDDGSIAFRTSGGGIQVYQAGVDTKGPVFIHKIKTGAGGNICADQNFVTIIDHPLTNNNPNAILLVTPNYGSGGTGTTPGKGRIPAVAYETTTHCGANTDKKWVIYDLAENPLLNNSTFNVIVIVP